MKRYIKNTKLIFKKIDMLMKKININKKDGNEFLNKGILNYKSNDYKEAKRFLEIALNLGFLDASYYLGLIHLDDRFEYFNYEKAKEYFYISAIKGNSSAQNNLGALFLNVYKDYEKAIKWFRLSAQSGEVKAQSNLGQIYYKGLGVEVDYIEAEKWLKKASINGYKFADEFLYNLYDEDGNIIDIKNKKLSIKNGIEKGECKSFYEMGQLYANGLGVSKDYEKAVEYFHKAAELGYEDAYDMLGSIYWVGLDNIDRDYKKSRYWYEKAAALGNPKAKLNLGVMYSKGLSVKKDYEKAFNFYLSAAKDGKMEAQFNVACNFQDGKGVEKNDKEAVKWFLKAAESGDKDAKYELGLCYKYGKGVEKNLNMATNYFIDSFENGCKLSENHLKDIRKIEKLSNNIIFTPKFYKNYIVKDEYKIEIPIEWDIDIIYNDDEKKDLRIIGKNDKYKINDIKLWITFVEFPYSNKLELAKYMKDMGVDNIKKFKINDNDALSFTKENTIGKTREIYIIRGENSIYFLKISLDSYIKDEYRQVINHILNSFKILNIKRHVYDKQLVNEMTKKAINLFNIINNDD
ncbi:sel1 repeat family protein [Clostridium senegalense]|uniref:tetratricopeptide repeat protein n=1 Tax=Clostridium senegalense TaxID=1465809 RepID=UPI001C115D64|nr:tetratricopeptide repeat protein [Clostridium senegalense]MBU5227118.1 sel1 repeat family protein [Clostridium senegalense]